MTDGDDVFSLETMNRINKIVEDVKNRRFETPEETAARVEDLKDMMLICHICHRIKGTHNLQPNWDGHPYCKDNLAFLKWKFESKNK